MTRVKRKTNQNKTKATGQYLLKSGQFAYIGRRDKKINFRSIWINRINGISKTLPYNQFISHLKSNRILLNRKMLAQLTIRDEPAFLTLNQI